MCKMLKIAVIGASGFTGVELVKLLKKHPMQRKIDLYSFGNAGKKIKDFSDQLSDYEDILKDFSKIIYDDYDLVFFACPNGTAMNAYSDINKSNVRMVDLEDGKIGIHAEVEVSRDYLQHLFSQRTPVVYEVEEILKKYHIDYNIWHDKIKKNITSVVDNYKVKLATPGIPVFAWKPMLFVIATVAAFYGWKFFNTIW